MQSFEHTPPEARELLARPIRDGELAAKGLARFRPGVYLSDEWACPDKEPVIGVPFYLADPKIAELERVVNDLEDEREILMYLRHEAGHAFNYAYQLYEAKEWLDLFGPFDRPYPDDYKPVPFSRKYVRHIAGWYAQKHPDEDFAETFAVWLTPDSDWQRRYAGWPALRKLKYVERVARELAEVHPRKALEVAVRELPVEEMRDTIEQYYREHEREQEVVFGDVPDSELEDIFVRRGEDLRSAAAFLIEHRKIIVDKITYWTGVRRAVIRKLLEAIARRARELEVVAFATTLAMNYLTRGGFTER